MSLRVFSASRDASAGVLRKTTRVPKLARGEPASARQCSGSDPRPGPLPASAPRTHPVAAPPSASRAETYGTSVTFLDSPAEAARQARRENKLLFVLHIAGNFEESCFT